MVLKTSRAMQLATRFVVVTQAHRRSIFAVTQGAAVGWKPAPSSHAAFAANVLAGCTLAPGDDAVAGAATPPPWLTAAQTAAPAAGTAGKLRTALDTLVDYLIDAGAVQLAVHALLFASPDVLRESDADRAESMFRKLVAKVLASKYIDASLAQCYLLSMSEVSAFNTFRAALPSLLGDFIRLGQVSNVGVSTARAWGQQLFLKECQALRTNAQWWHKLQSLGIAVDTKLFRQPNSDYPRWVWVCLLSVPRVAFTAPFFGRSFVSQLLERTHFDLTVALDYCDAYLIEREVRFSLSVSFLCFRVSLYPSRPRHPAVRGVDVH